MATRLFIGNLPRQTSDAELEGLFAEFGTVQSVEIMRDKETGTGKGFGFVEMGSDTEAQAAIKGMAEREVEGRKLTVDNAKPRKYRSGGGFNDSGFGGYGGGGGGYRGGGGRGRY
jgi:cold-inducible RNA-binding protein